MLDLLTAAHSVQPDLWAACLFETQNTTFNNVSSTNATELLLCVSDALSNSVVGSRNFTRSLMLILAGSMVFLMQAGFAMLCAGAVRRKNVQNTLLKNLVDACTAALAWYAVGYAFAFGGTKGHRITDLAITSTKTTFIGTEQFFMQNVDDLAFWFYEYTFSAASATIIAGTLAERCQMTAYFGYTLVLVGFVYPVLAHAIWSPQGFLSAFRIDPLWGVGMVDFAGAGVVHLTGGATALFATMILGPRRGRFHDDTGRKRNVPKEFRGHSMSLQVLGTFILWFGWHGFNCGSGILIGGPWSYKIVALAGVNTIVAGGVAGITSLLFHYHQLDRYTGEPYFDLKYAMNGLLCGLVAVTGGCGVLEPWAAAFTGLIAGFLYTAGSKVLLYFRLDDAVDAIPIHMLSAIWGLIAVGLLASPQYLVLVYARDEHPGWFYTLTEERGSDATLLGIQLCGILFIIGWTFITMFPFFIWMDWSGWFRSEPMEEIVGLDRSYHGGLALKNGEEIVHPEYIIAYKRRKKEGNVKKRRSRLRGDFDTDSARFELVGERAANLDDSSIGEEEDEPHSRIE